ncbi:MAG: methyltransferase domain-containing protein [Methanoregula sp.]
MQQQQNVKNWLGCWKSTKGFFSERSDSEQAESWNKRWSQPRDGMAMRMTPGRKQKRMDEIFELLDEAGCKVKGARVLDVGCGPGATSIPFAKAGAKVTSLDISTTALERVRKEAEKEGLSIETVESSWWTADIDKLGLRDKFDLVFVTSTPAVRDAGCFDRMIGCSRKYCYYSFSLGNGGHMQMDNRDIFENVLKRDPPRYSSGKGSLFVNGFMYLYLMGYRPLVRIDHHRRNVAVDWEEAADRMIKSLGRTEPCTAATKKKIRNYYKTSAVDGKFPSVSEGYSGMMVWNVNS